MGFIAGIQYNIRGVALALKTPSLLMLGLIRFAVVLLLALVLSGMVLYWHNDIFSMIWQMPESRWLIWLWYLVSWILTFTLMAFSMLISYLISQIFFCVFIMDYMSRITERMVLGQEAPGAHTSIFGLFLYLILQEIPRAVVPVLISVTLMIIGLFTPVSLVIIGLSAVVAGIFLAWDNTDLVPARRMVPFRERFAFLRKNLFFHIGFGLLFLVPWLNILFLSFAPVGATLYYIEKERKKHGLGFDL
ncbi:MAG: EI24 domain-containing protein [Desulfobacter postgatei]|uniref:EI24 domain-containing protein n=1 Tax=Desulfobacter postgatei TaxID=2293 RepID=UPI0023F3F43F|nr:EI24 domain-containing protein [Desulfobacter postgatei]MDD4272603.1 EI24 domain-containing protein [Desulfobacter postgatei]